MKYISKYKKILIGLIFISVLPFLIVELKTLLFGCVMTVNPGSICAYLDYRMMYYITTIVRVIGIIILIWGVIENIILQNRKRKS